MISGVMSDNNREKGLQYVSWADHHPGCDHPSHHITGENMLISEIYADTWDRPGGGRITRERRETEREVSWLRVVDGV